MRLERNVGVCCVLGRQVRREVVEAPVVRFADEGDAAEESFGGGWGVKRGLVYVAEAKFALDNGQTAVALYPSLRGTYNVLEHRAYAFSFEQLDGRIRSNGGVP